MNVSLLRNRQVPHSQWHDFPKYLPPLNDEFAYGGRVGEFGGKGKIGVWLVDNLNERVDRNKGNRACTQRKIFLYLAHGDIWQEQVPIFTVTMQQSLAKTLLECLHHSLS